MTVWPSLQCDRGSHGNLVVISENHKTHQHKSYAFWKLISFSFFTISKSLDNEAEKCITIKSVISVFMDK